MYPNLLHSLFTLIIITIATLFEVPTSSGQVIGTIYEAPTSSGQDVQRYDTCGQLSKCGDIDNISYPFSGASRPDYCGYPGFGLTCVSDTLLFKYQSISYRVLRIDYPAQIITVARNDLWDNICPQKFFNTTYDFTLFKYDSFGHQNLSLYYDCGQGTPTSNQFSCKLNGVTSNGYFVRTDAVPVDLETGLCSVNVIVPLNQASAQTLAASPSESALISALRSGFGLQWTENNTSCDRCVGSGGRCGSNTTSPSPVFSCYCADRPYPSICNETVGNSVPILFTVLVLVVLVGAVLLFATLYRYRRNLIFRKTGKTNDKDIEIFIRNHGPLTPKRYRYSEIKKMTNSFTDKLGQGGYGSVYKGNLHDGRLVAVKLLSEAKGGREDFMNEVASISKTSHVNVVTLLGFCFQGNKRALLYEFMPNGSLDRFICNNDSSDTSCHLDWKTLYQIVVGIARGLEYLHRGCNTRIVHFDIKPHNILLDEDFCPKISDFGLAKLCKRKDSVVSMLGARGTAGYIAPEVFLKNFGGASHKSDVYSYGMMVLEMTGARKNDNVGVTYTTETYFPDRIYKQVELGENLGVYGVTTEEEEIVRKMILVSLWCIQTNPSDRPSITKVVEMLEGGLQTLQVPPKPFLSSPMRPLQDSSPSFSQSSENIVVPTNANEILSSSTLHEKLQQEN